MKNNINFKLSSAIIAFLLLFFGASNTAFAGKIWDEYSLSAKTLAGNVLNRLSPNSGYGNYLKSTNFGIGPRIGSLIDNPFGTLRGSASYVTNGVYSRLSSLNTMIGNPARLLSPTSFNIRQNLPNLASLSANLSSLSNSLKKIGTALDTNISRTAGSLRINLYSLNSSLKQSSSAIFSQNQVINGFKNPLLSGIIPKYNNFNQAGRITDFRNIKIQ